MSLTPKQEAFAQAIASGLNQSDAYRSAYDAEGMKPSSINVNASKLMADAKVAQRVGELKAALEAKGLWTRERSVKALTKVIDSADKGAEVVAAVKELNAMHGFNAPQKHEHQVSGNLSITRIELVPLK